LQTCENIGTTISQDGETIYAIGETDPVAEKTNAKSYKGKFSVQVGEMAAAFKYLRISDATQIRGAVIAIVSFDGLFARSFVGVNVLSEAFDIKAKDKSSVLNMDFVALGSI
jgi:hypothetical protein